MDPLKAGTACGTSFLSGVYMNSRASTRKPAHQQIYPMLWELGVLLLSAHICMQICLWVFLERPLCDNVEELF